MIKKISYSVLKTKHTFHSIMMDDGISTFFFSIGSFRTAKDIFSLSHSLHSLTSLQVMNELNSSQFKFIEFSHSSLVTHRMDEAYQI